MLKGWDGIMLASSESSNIPEGASAWEIGCRKDYKAKADYSKRTDNPLGIEPEEITYVAVNVVCHPAGSNYFPA